MSPLDTMLREIKERTDKATEGPWGPIDYLCDRPVEGHLAIHVGEYIGGQRDGIFQVVDLTKADQDFIAHSRSDVPCLLAVIEKLRHQRNQELAYRSDTEEIMNRRVNYYDDLLIKLLQAEAE